MSESVSLRAWGLAQPTDNFCRRNLLTLLLLYQFREVSRSVKLVLLQSQDRLLSFFALILSETRQRHQRVASSPNKIRRDYRSYISRPQQFLIYEDPPFWTRLGGVYCTELFRHTVEQAP